MGVSEAFSKFCSLLHDFTLMVLVKKGNKIRKILLAEKELRNKQAQIHKEDNHGRKKRHIIANHVPDVKIVRKGGGRVQNQDKRKQQHKKPRQKRHGVCRNRVILDAFVLEERHQFAFTTVKLGFLQFGEPVSLVSEKPFYGFQHGFPAFFSLNRYIFFVFCHDLVSLNVKIALIWAKNSPL